VPLKSDPEHRDSPSYVQENLPSVDEGVMSDVLRGVGRVYNSNNNIAIIDTTARSHKVIAMIFIHYICTSKKSNVIKPGDNMECLFLYEYGFRPLFFEYLFYKPADHSWNLSLGNKIDFYSFYYYFCTNPSEHQKWIRLLWSLIQDDERSVPLRNYFYSKSVFKPRNLINLN